MMEWISVKDRFPEKNKLVFFYHNDLIHIGYYVNQSPYHLHHIWQSYMADENAQQDVEYWMALPSPPNETKEGDLS